MRLFSVQILSAAAFVVVFLNATSVRGVGADADLTTSAPAAADETSGSDFLGEEEWQRLPEEARQARSRIQTAERYEPEGRGSVARLDSYLQTFGKLNVYDERLYLYKVQGRHVAGTTGSVVLKGEVSLEQFRNGLESVLTTLGLNVTENLIKVLPADDLGPDRFGVSTTAAATLRREPKLRSEQVNSVALGGWVRLLREAAPDDMTTRSAGRRDRNAGKEPDTKWYLAQTLEGYIGFVRADEFERKSTVRLPDGIVEKSTTITAEGQPYPVPAGTMIYRGSDKFWTLYEGRMLPESAAVVPFNSSLTEQSILDTLAPLLGVRYVWGGVTGQGIDCSGFTQFFMRTRGVFLSRDAEQQATSGLIVGWGIDVEKAQPGDLIFFANDTGRISHVAISLGDGKIIHAADKRVHTANLRDRRNKDKSATHLDRALFARRILSR